MKKLSVLLIILFLFITIPVKADEVDIESNNAVLYNLNDNTIVYEKNKDKKVSIASLTKLMTALVAIEKIDDCFFGADFENSDYLAAKEAKRIGFCKIIPVKELPKEFDMRYFGWIDTPENRKAIENYCNR